MNNEISDLWEKYLIYNLRRSRHTVRAYVATANRFLTHLGRDAGWHDLAQCNARTMRNYMAKRRGDGLSNTSAARPR